MHQTAALPQAIHEQTQARRLRPILASFRGHRESPSRKSMSMQCPPASTLCSAVSLPPEIIMLKHEHRGTH